MALYSGGSACDRNATESRRNKWNECGNCAVVQPFQRNCYGVACTGRLAGLKFRRQAPIGPFIVDFYCADKLLVIELDGLSHDETESYDQERTQFLEQSRLRVIRYTNDDVLGDADAVAEDIARCAGV